MKILHHSQDLLLMVRAYSCYAHVNEDAPYKNNENLMVFWLFIFLVMLTENETLSFMKKVEEKVSYVEVPAKLLSSEALRGIIDSFIFREGTDYGLKELSHEAKMKDIQIQLDQNKIKIVFDANDESMTLMTSEAWSKLHR